MTPGDGERSDFQTNHWYSETQLVEGIRCISARSEISTESLAGRRIQRAFCKGSHIFIAFQGGSFLHNHLLMRGTWKKLGGNQLFLPDDAWLGLHVGAYTICNLNGQMLKLVGQDEVARQLASLGPEAMSQPYPADEIRAALAACKLPISEALLSQSVVAGVGNIAKSEILFRTGQRCRICGCAIRSVKLAPSKRATYFCPSCQR